MKNDRRTFLKTAALAGAAATSGLGGLATPAAARTGAAAARAGTQELPKGMTFATLRRGSEYGLGIRTERGVLDVARPNGVERRRADDHQRGARGRGRHGGARPAHRQGAGGGQALLLPENAADFGPCVTDPEKIICIGLNYRKHAAETGNPVPPAADPLQQVQHRRSTATAARSPSRRSRPRSSTTRPSSSSSSGATRATSARPTRRLRLRLLHRQRLHGARPAEPHEPVDDRQVPRRLGADRPLARHRRPGRRRQPEDRVPGQRRGAAVLEHRGHGVRLQEARQLHLETHDAEARRHHLHRHAGGRDLGICRRTSRSGSKPATRSRPRSRSWASCTPTPPSRLSVCGERPTRAKRAG